MVWSRHSQLWPPHPATLEPELLKGLRTGHLMHQLQVDIEQSLLPRLIMHDMIVPDFFKKGPGDRYRGIFRRGHQCSEIKYGKR